MNWDALEQQASGGRDKQFMENYRAALQRGDPDFLDEVQKTIDGLDEDLRESLEAEARQRGRTVLEQVLYELRAQHGFCPIDEGDTLTAAAARINHCMRMGRPHQG